MKNFTPFTIILLIASSATSNANESSYSSSHPSGARLTSLNISGGMGFSTIATKDPSLSTFMADRKALNMAAMIDLPLSDYFSVTTGLNYIQKGAALVFSTTAFGGIDFSSNIVLNYIELPLILQGKVDLGGSTLSIGAGPFAALALSRKMDTRTNSTSANMSVDQTTDASNTISSIDYGMRVGLNFDAPLNNNFSFLVGANYDLGLKNINTSGTSDITKTRSMLANVGLGIKI